MVVLQDVVVTFPNRTAQSETIWAKQLQDSPGVLQLIISTVHPNELCDDNMSNPTTHSGKLVGL